MILNNYYLKLNISFKRHRSAGPVPSQVRSQFRTGKKIITFFSITETNPPRHRRHRRPGASLNSIKFTSPNELRTRMNNTVHDSAPEQRSLFADISVRVCLCILVSMRDPDFPTHQPGATRRAIENGDVSLYFVGYRLG